MQIKYIHKKGGGAVGKDVGREAPLSTHGGPVNIFKRFGKKGAEQINKIAGLHTSPKPQNCLVEWC